MNSGWKDNRLILENLQENTQLIDILYNNEKKTNITSEFLFNYIFKQLPKDFSWIDYLNLNKDLQNTNFNGEYGAIFHYIHNGKQEKRNYKILSQDFSNKSEINYINIDFDKNNSESNETINHNHNKKKQILIIYHLGSNNYNFTYNLIYYLLKFDIFIFNITCI